MRGFLSRVRTSAMCLALAGCSLLGVPQACADTYPTEAMIGVGEWWFAPILVDQPTGCKTVHSFLALSTKVDTVGNNLVAVWYVRPSTTDEVWTAWTWESSDQWDAIKYVRDTLGISESYDSVWPTSDTQYAGPGQTPVLYDKGFVETDLVGQAIGPAPDRDIWIDVLKDIGYQVADVVFDKTPLEGHVVHCDQKGWLNTMAASVEMTLYDPSEEAGVQLLNSFISECQPGLVSIAAVPLADTLAPTPFPVPPPGWTPIAPSPANPSPGRVSKWSCSFDAATAICTCTSSFYEEWTGAGPCPGTTWTPKMITCLCIIRGITTCTSTAACSANSCNSGNGTPNTTTPGAIPGTSTGMPGGCVPACTVTYWYYR